MPINPKRRGPQMVILFFCECSGRGKMPMVKGLAFCPLVDTTYLFGYSCNYNRRRVSRWSKLQNRCTKPTITDTHRHHYTGILAISHPQPPTPAAHTLAFPPAAAFFVILRHRVGETCSPPLSVSTPPLPSARINAYQPLVSPVTLPSP